MTDGAGTATAREPEELVAAFRERAAPLGIQVAHAAGAREGADTILALAREIGADGPLASSELAAAAPGLVAALAAARLPTVPAGEPETSRDAPLGLSLARLAVAETASVLLAEDSLEDRGIGLLVATHLVVCPTAALAPSLDDAAPVSRRIASRRGGGYAPLVTGPSRTADIERVLTVGVQGPARLAVLFVDHLA